MRYLYGTGQGNGSSCNAGRPKKRFAAEMSLWEL